LYLERLEDRVVPTIVFEPYFGAEPTSYGGGPVLSNTPVYLIFWGYQYWGTLAGIEYAAKLTSALKSELNSPLYGNLKQYTDNSGHTTGPAYVEGYWIDNVTPGPLNPPYSFSDSQLHSVVNDAISNWLYSGIFQPLVTEAADGGHEPIYLVFTPPLVSSQKGVGVSGYHSDFNAWYNYGGFPYNENVVYGWAGEFAGNSSGFGPQNFQDFATVVASHEIGEALTDPLIGDQNYGITAASGANFPSPGTDEIGDFEPESGGGYTYRINGSLVQALWDKGAQAFTVSDGNSQNFTITPQWTYNTGYHYTGNKLTVQGDQLGANYNDTVTINKASNGGLTVTLNGQTAAFDPGQITSLEVDTGGGSNTVNILGLPTNTPTTIVGDGVDTVTVGNSSTSLGSQGSMGGINSNVTVEGTGSITLNVDDSGDASGKSVTVNSGTISYPNTNVSYTATNSSSGGVVNLNIYGGSGGNAFNVEGTSNLYGSTSLNSGAGNDTVNVYGATGQLSIDNPGGQDTVNVGLGSMSNINGSVDVSGVGSTALVVDDSSDNNTRTATLTSSQLSGLGNTGTISYGTGVTSLTVNGGSGAVAWNIQSTAVTTPVTINGGAAADTFNLGSGNSLGGILGALTVNGGGGSNVLNANDSSSASGQSYTLSSTQLTRSGIAAVNFASLAAIDITASGKTNDEGDSVSLAILAMNAGSFSATSLPTGLSINSSTGVISGAIDPRAAANSPYAATVTASGNGLSASVSFSWTVNDSTPPSFKIGNQTNTEGDLVNLATNPVDADAGSVTATGLPAGLSIDPNTGVISGAIASNAAGNYTVTVSADDGTLVGSTTFTWTVNTSVSTSTVVTSTADSGAGSLRQAILNANASSSTATIVFNIPTSDSGYNASTGTWTIAPLSALPVLTAPVIIDGTSQPGYKGTPLIVLSGASAGSNAVGLDVTGGNSTIKGLVINQFSGNGIDLATNGGDVVEGDYIGTDATGTSAAGNGGDGVLVTSAGNIIGGATAANRNVISGNKVVGVDIETANNNTVEGNYVGTNAAGTAALGNTYRGVFVNSSSGDVIGGTAAGAGNVLAGSTKYEGLGIYASTGVTVQGNRIGANAAGTAALPNSGNGVEIENSTAITVGGSTAAARNIVSGNLGIGVRIYNGSSVTVQGDYIGADVSGAVALGNGGQGVLMDGGSHGNLLAGNVISANALGVYLDSTTSGVQVQGNYIGSNAAGTSALANGSGVVVAGSNNTIGGTATGARNVISGNTANGISINSGASGVVVQGNYIGTDVTGTSALANGSGIVVAGSNNTIGGTATGARNVISGNAADGISINSGVSGVQVQGNYIGTDTKGTSGLGNKWGFVIAGSNNTIGGTATGARNVISGNSATGIFINSGVSGVQVQGNYIGTDVTGISALANSSGVVVAGSNNTIGGTSAGAGNVISGNTATGISINSGVSGVLVQGNYIGTDLTGISALANNSGVVVAGSNNTIGGNAISGNANDGVLIDSGATGNAVQGNYIGTNVGGSAALANSGNGVEVDGNNNTIGSGNVISGNSLDGVLIGSGASGAAVQGNFIGTDATGAKAIGNSVGIAAANANNTIGGTTSGARNLISGNKYGVVIDSGVSGVAVQGNYVGTDITGAKAVANYEGIEVTGSNNTIGGTASGALNVISGNSYGVVINSGVSGVAVQGNYIGTDVTGANALANSFGVWVYGNNNTIGGTTSAARNVISGNSSDGVNLYTAVSGVAVQGNYIGTNAAGSAAVANSIGIEVTGNNNTIGGITSGAVNVISGNKYAVVINSGVSGVAVQGNYIGTDVTGANAVANYEGVEAAGSNNTIGGTTSAARNVISGNSYGVVINSGVSGVAVQGNYIGTDVTGAKAVANNFGIWVYGSNNTIGGTTSGAINVISGNSYGVLIDGASGVAVQGNYVGTDVTGAKTLANYAGIWVAGSTSTIGGTTSGARNVIAGNSYGVVIDSSVSGVAVQGNYIGIDVTGAKALANYDGIYVFGFSNTIGGSVLGARNVISGNSNDGVVLDSSASGNQVVGNFIGVGVSGTSGVGNVANAIEIAGSSNTIGGTIAGYRNVISGSGNDGVLIDSTGANNLLQGNFVGTDYSGKAAVANSGSGIEIQGTGNTVGGTASGARNILAGNSKDGVLIGGSASGNVVQGDWIGVNFSGAALGNGGNGLNIAGNSNTVGGTVTAARNVISGNTGDGVLIASGASGNQVQGNFIGADITGSKPLANSIGIEVAGNSNTIGGASGARNLISGNSNDGVKIDSGGSGNVVLGNYIGVNTYDTTVVGNSGNGIEVAGNSNTIGASYAVAPNEISGNTGDGVLLDSGSSGNVVLGNYIGTNHGGTAAVANKVGIEDAGSSNTLGGSVLGARNVISGNTGDGVLNDSTATAETIEGNYIGLNVGGNTALANGSNGVEIQGMGNIIGGNAANYFVRNFISGNGNDGVLIHGSANQVVGNFIGVGANGATKVGNGADGIEIASSSNTIGGTVSGIKNVISGSGNDGVLIDGTGANNLLQGNFIGTDYSGRFVTSNSGNGIEIQGTGNTIGGGSGARNLISGNTNDGVKVDSGASGNLVEGNNIGVNIYDNAAVGNSGNGIEVAGHSNTIGASYAVAPNEISGNMGDGVLLDSGSSGNQVQGNYIGSNHGGTAAVANKIGIEDAGSSNTLGGSVLGARNVISGNTGDGVLLDSTATAETMQGNYIGLNVGGNTALANGSNGVEIQGAGNTIGGNSGTNYFFRNFISGNKGDGVLFDSGASGNQVVGNFIGVGVSGTNGVGNVANAIEIAGSSNTIGGTISGYRNVISGSGNDGVLIDSTGVNNLLQGNFVGTDYTGKNPVANSGNGIEIAGNNNTVGGTVSGAGNVVSGNSKNGVLVSAGSGNEISRNSIFANAGLGISLASGANNNVAAASLSSATTSGSTLAVTGTFNAPTANVAYVLEFFANLSGDGEGKIYLGSLTVTPTSTGTQNFTFTTTTTVTGTYPLITATLTDATGDTSAFSTGVVS
jgi:parallel beta-helix repeat protein